MNNKNIDAWRKSISGWVFLSHSSKDIEQVKIIRNYLEESQFNAIMFFLKCLDDQSKQQIEELLHCEIEKRNIFIHCKSNDSLESKWVKWEIDKAKKENKLFLEIDLDKLEYQKCIELSKIDILIRYSTLYFIYYSSKSNIIGELEAELEGFKIIKNSESFKKNNKQKYNTYRYVQETIKEIKQKGFVLLFISQDTMYQQNFWDEKQVALDENVRIINILLDEEIVIENFPALRTFKTIRYQDTNQLHRDIYSYIKQEFENELRKFEEGMIK